MISIIDLFYFAFGIIDLYIVLAGPITNLLSAAKKLLLLIVITVSTIIQVFLLPAVTPYLTLILAFVLIFFFTHRNLLTVCLSLFNYLLSIVLTYLILAALDSFWGITEYVTLQEYYIPYNLFLTVLFLISSYLVRQTYNHFVGNSIAFPTHLEVFTLIYLCICAALFIYNYNYESSLHFSQDMVRVNTVLFTLFFFVTGIFIILLIYLLRREADIKAQNAQYEGLQQYTAQLEALYQNIRAFKHDYVNILSTMYGFMEHDEWQPLKAYYEQEILPLNHTFQDESQELAKLSNLQIPELKGILYNKLVKSLELGIHTSVEIRKPVSEIHAKHVDIARVLGIYLDNAVEALNLPELAPEDRRLYVAIWEDAESVTFVIRNYCKDLPLNIHKLGTMNYSTKGQNRGLGLHIAAQTLRPYKNIHRDTTYENHMFTQMIKIFKE